MRIKIKPEFQKDYPEIDPDIWYEVYQKVLDKFLLAPPHPVFYLLRKFEVEKQ